MTKKILIVVTSHSSLGDTGKATGLYLPELAHPYEVFIAAGCQVTVASPFGGRAPVAPESISKELKPYLQLVENTKVLDQIDPGDYDAYFVVGGHGTMWDLPHNKELQRILAEAYAQEKILAAVCHGPAALVGLKDLSGQALVKNKKVTSFTSDEEDAGGLKEAMPFLLEDALRRAGAHFIKADNWQANVVIDGKLVTGQNPASAQGVGEAIISLLT